MRKINFGLIILTIICSFFTISHNLDKEFVFVLKDLSIIITVSLPYIFNKLFKVGLPEGFTFIWIVFIFMAHYLGVIAGGYSSWTGFDKVTHFMSGILTAYIGLFILKKQKINSKTFEILFIISFTWLCAGIWETFEFTCNALFGGDAQKVMETGVDDTMLDMIVAFIGSVLFSFWYIKTNSNKNRKIVYKI